MQNWKEKYLDLEKKLAESLKKPALLCLRYSMALIYFWYGFLKIIGLSPAEELVYRATHWVGTHQVVIFIGVWEVLIGICLAIKKLNRLGLLLLFLQFPGTFLPLFLNPEDCFTQFPFGLTLEGQYIFKNLVLISVGLLLISNLQEDSEHRFNLKRFFWKK